jgi:hypothetical protein
MYDFATICFMQVAARNMRENLRCELEGIDMEPLESRPTRMTQLRQNLSVQLITLGHQLQAQNGAGQQPALRTAAK